MFRPNSAVFFAIATVVSLLLNRVAAAEQLAVAPQSPAIPQQTFTITDFGAVNDGSRVSTTAFRAAVEACAKAAAAVLSCPPVFCERTH